MACIFASDLMSWSADPPFPFLVTFTAVKHRRCLAKINCSIKLALPVQSCQELQSQPLRQWSVLALCFSSQRPDSEDKGRCAHFAPPSLSQVQDGDATAFLVHWSFASCGTTSHSRLPLMTMTNFHPLELRWIDLCQPCKP